MRHVQVEYLRPVRAMLLFPDDHGSAVLLSEREADTLLELLWGACSGGGGGSIDSDAGSSVGLRALRATASAVVLASLPALRQAVEDEAPPRLALSGPVGSGLRPQAVPKLTDQQLPSVVALQLFDGDTQFRTAAQKRVLFALVRQRLPAAEQLTSMRGKQMLLPRSDLEDACGDDLFLK
jgi:hypothetical protein